MSYFIAIAAAILVFGILIILHELGHYLAGRLLKLPVVEFAIGMGPRLLGFRRKGIDYSIRLLPIGGFCAFNGEDDPDADLALPDQNERTDIPPAWRNLNNCPPWRRLVMQFAGSAMNLLAAYLCAVVILCALGVPSMTSIAEISPGSPAETAGMLAGDHIIAVNGDETASLQSEIQKNPEAELNVTLLRGEETVDIRVTPEYFADTQSIRLGINLGYRFIQMPLAYGLKTGAQYCVNVGAEMIQMLRNLVFRGEGAGDVMGIVGTVDFMANQTASFFEVSFRSGVYVLMDLTILIALNLGIINLLPIPALDGGRIVFTLFELIFRRPFPRKAEAWVHTAGFMLLMGLMVFLLFKDIFRIAGIGGGA